MGPRLALRRWRERWWHWTYTASFLTCVFTFGVVVGVGSMVAYGEPLGKALVSLGIRATRAADPPVFLLDESTRSEMRRMVEEEASDVLTEVLGKRPTKPAPKSGDSKRP